MFVVLILIIGCSGVRTREPKRSVDYRTGSEGLVLDIVSDFDRIYEFDQDVNVVVEVRNRGAFPQAGETIEAYIWAGGFDTDILELRTETGNGALDTTSLEGKSPVNLDGGYTAAVFEADVHDLPSGTPSYKTPIIIDATYKYKTIASPIICVDPNPSITEIKERVCEVGQYGSVSLKGSQGAPVAVTRVEEDVTSNYILFRIYVDNVGGGRVIPKDGSHGPQWNPNKGYDWDELNKVYINRVTVGNTDVDSCSPDVGSNIDVEKGRGYILCRFQATGDGVYKSPLNIELEYGYQSSIRQDIEVIKEVQI